MVQVSSQGINISKYRKNPSAGSRITNYLIWQVQDCWTGNNVIGNTNATSIAMQVWFNLGIRSSFLTGNLVFDPNLIFRETLTTDLRKYPFTYPCTMSKKCFPYDQSRNIDRKSKVGSFDL